MSNFLSPEDEARRLAALRDLVILDSPPEPLFDTITRMASEICGTPIALISLIDEERQWFKANVGLEGVNETPRDMAFCAHAIHGDVLMEVPDALSDPRFSGNPLVTGAPHIRFYAGAPLVLPSGDKAGTLCVIDRASRQLDAQQVHSLQMLATLVSQSLAMRRDLIHRSLRIRKESEDALRESHVLLDRTGRIARVGGWIGDLQARLLHCSPQTCSLLDLSPGCVLDWEQVCRMFPQDEQARIRQEVDGLLRDGGALDLEARMTTSSGRALWVRLVAEVERDGTQPVRLVGALQDITERRQHKAELQREHALRLQIEQHANELNDLLREREEMLDVLAHEVRQPLNNASAALQSANAVLLNMEDKAAFNRLGRAQGVLSQVLTNIDNTLAAAALLANKEPIEMVDTDLDTLVAVAMADVPSDVRPRILVERLMSTRTIHADMGLMRLALRNLLFNALKYSPADSTVTIRLVDWDEPLATVIEVEDHGPGFDADLVPRLFQRGARGRHHAAGSGSGHGLGLYIVRRIMELHGGRVALARNSPQGSTLQLIIEPAH
jgi:signal transduction histidine kinase